MRVERLLLENIGPFDNADLSFGDKEDPERATVTLITGENGTGKSVLIDAIRALFGAQFVHRLERKLHRPDTPFSMVLHVYIDGNKHKAQSVEALWPREQQYALHSGFKSAPDAVGDGRLRAGWVVDYWRPSLGHGAFETRSLEAPEHRNFLRQALAGIHTNADLAKLVCHFDYIQDSRDAVEKALGKALYGAASQIIKASLLEGELDHVARGTLTPLIRQYGRRIELDKLSAGSLYMIHRMITLLGRMYSCVVVGGTQHSDPLKVPGLLLIDEAEDHLHPKWQKRLIPTIRKLFPNLQIIAATHSPFILASVKRPTVYVCRATKRGAVVEDATRHYENLPVDEILASPAFAETYPFSEDITDLYEMRKRAIEEGDDEERKRLEGELKKANAEYFGYFDLPELLSALETDAP